MVPYGADFKYDLNYFLLTSAPKDLVPGQMSAPLNIGQMNAVPGGVPMSFADEMLANSEEMDGEDSGLEELLENFGGAVGS